MTPRPFVLDIPDAAIAYLKTRRGMTRFPDAAPGEPWAFGSSVDDGRELVGYWKDRFDWRAGSRVECLSAIQGAAADIDVHYQHAPGKGPNPYPLLLLLHGWPGSVYEFLDIIPRLTDPRASAATPWSSRQRWPRTSGNSFVPCAEPPRSVGKCPMVCLARLMRVFSAPWNQAEPRGLVVTESIATPLIKATKMKMLKRLLRFSRKRPETRRKPQIPAKPYSVLDADEFTRLLTSRRRGDLKILARKLSVPSKVKI